MSYSNKKFIKTTCSKKDRQKLRKFNNFFNHICVCESSLTDGSPDDNYLYL